MKKYRILVVGGNSFVASHFKDYVIANHVNQIEAGLSIDRETSSDEGFFTQKAIDVLDEIALKQSIIQFAPDYIVNFVGSFSASTLNESILVNVGVSNSICDVITEAALNIKKLLLIGSAAEYGYPSSVPILENASLSPVNHYGLSKVIQLNTAEYYTRVKKIPLSVARTFNIIGKGISANLSIGAFFGKIQAIDNTGEIEVGNLSAKRDFLDVRDVVSAYWSILCEDEPQLVYNVCRGESIAMSDIVKMMIDASGKKVQLKSDVELQREFDVDDIYGDNSILIKNTGWRPQISLGDSINNLFS